MDTQSSQSAMPTPAMKDVRLTFGVEFECMIDNRNLGDDDEAPYEAVAECIRAEGCGANVYLDKNTYPPPHTFWTVTDELTLKPEPERVNTHSTLEISTSVHELNETGIGRIESVMRRVNGAFDLHLNRSCGLHVHVGLEGSEFPYESIRNLSMLVLAFEEQLESLHPLDRVRWGESGKATYTASNGTVSIPLQAEESGLARALVALQTNEGGMLRLVRTMQSHGPIDGLTALRSEAYPRQRNFGVNLYSLFEDVQSTVEFRQHEGTLDMSRVAPWVRFLGKLMSFAHACTTEELLEVLSLQIEGDSSAIDFMKAIGAYEEAEYYGSRLYNHSAAESGRPSVSVEKRAHTFERIRVLLEW